MFFPKGDDMRDVPPQKETFLSSLSPGFGTLLLGLWICNLFAPFLVSGVTAILPSIGADLRARAVHLSLVMVVYALGQVIFSTIGGRFGSLWGLRRVLLASVCMFTVVSVSTGFVPDVDTLLALRFFQGACAATISSCCTAIGMRMAPPAQRGQVIGIMTSAVYLGLTLGPLIGGGVATVAGWRWLFIGILPPGIAVWWILRRNIRQEWADAAGERLDVPGAILLSLGLGCIAFGGGCYGVAPAMLWLVLPGMLCMGIFFWWQWRAPSPVVDLHMFRESPGLLTGLLAMFVNYGSTMGMVFFLSLYLQEVRGFTPFHAGLCMMVQSFAQVLASPCGGRLADRFGPERVSALGMLLCGMGILGVAMLDKTTPLLWMASSQVLLGTGMGTFGAPNTVATLGQVPARHLSVASGIMGSMRTMGGLLSQVIIAFMLGWFMGDSPITPEHADTYLLTMRTTLVCFGALNIFGLCIGLKRLAGKPPHA